MTPNRRPRGFSLLEVLISTTIVIVGIALGAGAFLTQNKALQAMDLTRNANSSTRDAMLTLESALRQAGWGIDPRFVIDLAGPVAQRSTDSATAPDSLAVLSRNPNYRWLPNGQTTPVACSTAGGCYVGRAWPVGTTGPVGSFAITLGAGQVIEKGRMLLATCDGAQFPVIVTSSANYTAGAVTVAADSTAAFPYNDTTSLQACHKQVGASLFVIDHSRFFVQTFSAVPWLMLDTGVDVDASGTIDANDLIPVARNVEDFQVAYVFNGSGAGTDVGNTNWIVGDNPGSVELPNAPASVTSLPLYTTEPTDVSRLTLSAANVRAIRISLILRSARQDPNQALAWPGDVMTRSENRSATSASGGRLRRYSVVSEISLRNLESSRPFTY